MAFKTVPNLMDMHSRKSMDATLGFRIARPQVERKATGQGLALGALPRDSRDLFERKPVKLAFGRLGRHP